MKNPLIAARLKQYRKNVNMTVKDVSKAISSSDITVADKTIYGWESGHTQPDADMLLKLCDLYNIEDILSSFGYRQINTPPHIVLSPYEKELIYQYRLHPEMHEAIHRLLYMEEKESEK